MLNEQFTRLELGTPERHLRSGGEGDGKWLGTRWRSARSNR